MDERDWWLPKESEHRQNLLTSWWLQNKERKKWEMIETKKSKVAVKTFWSSLGKKCKAWNDDPFKFCIHEYITYMRTYVGSKDIERSVQLVFAYQCNINISIFICNLPIYKCQYT